MSKQPLRQEFVEALLAKVPQMADRMVERTRAEAPSFAAVPIEEQRAAAEDAIERMIRRALGDPASAAPDDGERLEELGQRRAGQGVPVDDLIGAWRMGVEEVTSAARELAPRFDVPQDAVFVAFQDGLAIADRAMRRIARGHHAGRRAETLVESRAAFVRGVLTSALSAEEIRGGALQHGLDPAARYRAIRSTEASEAAVERFDRALGISGLRTVKGLVAIEGEELLGFCAGEPPRGLVETLAVGSSQPLIDLSTSFRTAGRVLDAATRFGLVGMHDLESAGPLIAVIETPEVGEAMSRRFIDPVREVKSAEEVMASVREWLSCGMKVDAAAERMHVHPNTLRYRLKRFEELSETDLDDTEDRIRVWWALSHELAERARRGDSSPRKQI